MDQRRRNSALRDPVGYWNFSIYSHLRSSFYAYQRTGANASSGAFQASLLVEGKEMKTDYERGFDIGVKLGIFLGFVVGLLVGMMWAHKVLCM